MYTDFIDFEDAHCKNHFNFVSIKYRLFKILLMSYIAAFQRINQKKGKEIEKKNLIRKMTYRYIYIKRTSNFGCSDNLDNVCNDFHQT